MVLASHSLEHSIRARLNGQMNVAADSRRIGDGFDYLVVKVNRMRRDKSRARNFDASDHSQQLGERGRARKARSPHSGSSDQSVGVYILAQKADLQDAGFF